MKTFGGSGSFARYPWLSSTLVLLAMAACSTNPPADGAQPVSDAGYAEADTEHRTGSASTVNADQEGAPHLRTLVEMLSRMPGVQVLEGTSGGSMTIRVRGAGSFMSGQSPLFVVDGMAIPSFQAIADMNASTIASISVLKDAADTAIYGARGANGVILIKTKR